MLFTSIILLTALLLCIQSLQPRLELRFSPEEKYYAQGNHVEIFCEILNPTDPDEVAQLWYVDLKTGQRTPISRLLFHTPPEDAPVVFKQNRNCRLEYLKNNHIRIRQLHLKDLPGYACMCPDCEESLNISKKELIVMKLVVPKWIIEPFSPLQENLHTKLKYIVDDFYLYVSHQIIRYHHDITSEGKSATSSNKIYPQNFSWEAIVTPPADWHNTSLHCVVVQEKTSGECSYAENPQPELIWHRQPIRSERDVNIQVLNEHHGKYQSILTFDRQKLISTFSQDSHHPKSSNYSFIAKSTLGNENLAAQRTVIVRDVNQPESESVVNSSRKIIQYFYQ